MELLVLPYLHQETLKFQVTLPVFCYSTEVMLSSYYQPLHFEIEIFHAHFAKSKIATMVRECKFVYSQAPAEPAE